MNTLSQNRQAKFRFAACACLAIGIFLISRVNMLSRELGVSLMFLGGMVFFQFARAEPLASWPKFYRALGLGVVASVMFLAAIVVFAAMRAR